MALTIITADYERPKRSIPSLYGQTRGARACCEVCRAELDYFVGSIAWECKSHDLCIDHWLEARKT